MTQYLGKKGDSIDAKNFSDDTYRKTPSPEDNANLIQLTNMETILGIPKRDLESLINEYNHNKNHNRSFPIIQNILEINILQQLIHHGKQKKDFSDNEIIIINTLIQKGAIIEYENALTLSYSGRMIATISTNIRLTSIQKDMEHKILNVLNANPKVFIPTQELANMLSITKDNFMRLMNLLGYANNTVVISNNNALQYIHGKGYRIMPKSREVYPRHDIIDAIILYMDYHKMTNQEASINSAGIAELFNLQGNEFSRVIKTMGKQYFYSFKAYDKDRETTQKPKQYYLSKEGIEYAKTLQEKEKEKEEQNATQATKEPRKKTPDTTSPRNILKGWGFANGTLKK